MTPPNLSLVAIMVCFWIAYWVIQKLLLQPVSRVTAERQRRLDDAESVWAAKSDAYSRAIEKLQHRMENAAREASRHRTAARESALAERQERLDRAHAAAQERLDGALKELEHEAAAASRELEGSARELAQLLASHLLEREIAV